MQVNSISLLKNTSIQKTNNQNKNNYSNQYAPNSISNIDLNNTSDAFYGKNSISFTSRNFIELSQLGIKFPEKIADEAKAFVSYLYDFCHPRKYVADYIEENFIKRLNANPEVAKLQLDYLCKIPSSGLWDDTLMDKVFNITSDIAKAKKELKKLPSVRNIVFAWLRDHNYMCKDPKFIERYPKRGDFDPSNIAVELGDSAIVFRIISPNLVTGPLKTNIGMLKKFKSLGVTGMVDLCGANYGENCKKVGLNYFPFDLSGLYSGEGPWSRLESYTPEEFAKKVKEFIDFINSNKVYMHCAQGIDRTNLGIALNYHYNPKQNYTKEMDMFSVLKGDDVRYLIPKELAKKNGLSDSKKRLADIHIESWNKEEMARNRGTLLRRIWKKITGQN